MCIRDRTKAVGIAKGSFYKFYESKEMAFFVVLESIHSELYGVADQALHRNGGLPTSERAAEAVLAVCRRLSDTGDMVFIEHDAKLLLQRLPEGVKKEHYHDEDVYKRQTIFPELSFKGVLLFNSFRTVATELFLLPSNSNSCQ